MHVANEGSPALRNRIVAEQALITGGEYLAVDIERDAHPVKTGCSWRLRPGHSSVLALVKGVRIINKNMLIILRINSDELMPSALLKAAG